MCTREALLALRKFSVMLLTLSMSQTQLQPRTQPNLARAGESLLAPQEILVALLTLNPQAEGLPLKAITAALTRCFEMLDPDQGLIFHPQALASTMQQLVVRQALHTPCRCSGEVGLSSFEEFYPTLGSRPSGVLGSQGLLPAHL